MRDTKIDQLLLMLAWENDISDLPAVDEACRRRLRSEMERERSRALGAPFIPIRFRLRSMIALAASVLLAGAYVAPATHGALESVFKSFSGWVAGHDEAGPGRVVAPNEDLPAWVVAQEGEKRILAEAGGEQLVAIRSGEKLTLALAGFGETGTISGLSRSVAGDGIVIVGPGRFLSDDHNRRSLFGLTSSAIESVQFTYADGSPPVVASGLDGAFGIVIETDRRPASISGYDASGRRITQLIFASDPRDLSPGHVLGDFRYCPGVSDCLPWHR
jgi:hypothetical protein